MRCALTELGFHAATQTARTGDGEPVEQAARNTKARSAVTQRLGGLDLAFAFAFVTGVSLLLIASKRDRSVEGYAQ